MEGFLSFFSLILDFNQSHKVIPLSFLFFMSSLKGNPEEHNTLGGGVTASDQTVSDQTVSEMSVS